MKSLFTVTKVATSSSNGPCPGLPALLGQGRKEWETCPVALEGLLEEVRWVGEA